MLATLVFGQPVLASLVGALVALVGWAAWTLHLKTRLSPFYPLNGPKPDSWVMGNIGPITKAGPGEWHDAQSKIYGRTFRYTGLGGEPRLYTTDPVAFNYLMKEAYRFPKPEVTRRILAKMLGEGLLVAEGDIHKRQRRIINPAFSAVSIKPLVPIFYHKAEELKEILLGGDTAVQDDSFGKGIAEDGLVDVMFWLGRATLDVIGLAGFDYDFSSLRQQENELALAFKDMFAATTQVSFLAIAQYFLPVLGKLPSERKRTTKKSMEVLSRVGAGIVQGKKAIIASEAAGEKAVKKSDVEGRDVISMLIRANMASDASVSQRLSDDEVLAQVTTFMLAGYETSSTALTWTLHLLASNPEAQDKLRAELLAVPEAEPSIDVLNGLPYLDAVVKESLRIESPVSGTVRMAAEDEVIPLSVPVVGRDGKEMTSVNVSKGTAIFVGILNMNREPEIWGPDAHEFKPERWIDGLPETASKGMEVPFAHIATFIAGPRGCIGWRFALLEIKAFLFGLLRAIKFDNPTPALEYIHRTSLVQRPLIKGREAEGYQMRLKLTKV